MKGTIYHKAHSLAEPSWQPNLVRFVSSGKTTIFTYIKIHDYLFILLLDHRPTKEIRTPTTLGCASAPFKIGRLIRSLGKGFSQPHPPLRGILQSQGPMDLAQPT